MMWSSFGSSGPVSLGAIATVGILAGAVTACTGQATSTMEILAQDSLEEPSELAGLRLTVNGRALTADHFEDRLGAFGGTSFSVPDSGELYIELELSQEGQIVASGALTVEMRPDFLWRLGISRGVVDPSLPGCLGCSVQQDFPIEPEWQNESGERIWIIGGGGPRDGSIVY